MSDFQKKEVCVIQYALIFVGVFLLAFVVIIIRNKKINGEINQNGIETDAVVSRIKENVTTDEHGTSVTYTFYVTYRTMNGQTVEARLGSGKSVDFKIGKKAWDYDLEEGTKVRIKYLPEKTNYAIRVD